MGEGVNDNGWRADLDQTQADPDGVWMTRDLADGWRVHIRLVSNSHKTAIDQLRIEPGDSTLLHGIRGHIDVPSGDPQDPTWQRVNLPTARREASEVLHAALNREDQLARHREAERQAQLTPAERREPTWRMLPLLAQFRGFTTASSRPPRRRPHPDHQLHLAEIASAYAAAQRDRPLRPREATRQRLQRRGLHYDLSTIGPLIAEARAAGMLTPTKPGKAAGQLTPKAQKLLAKADIGSDTRRAQTPLTPTSSGPSPKRPLFPKSPIRAKASPKTPKTSRPHDRPHPDQP